MRKIREEETKTELSGLEQPHRTTVVSTQDDFNYIHSVFRGCNECVFLLSQHRDKQAFSIIRLRQDGRRIRLALPPVLGRSLDAKLTYLND